MIRLKTPCFLKTSVAAQIDGKMFTPRLEMGVFLKQSAITWRCFQVALSNHKGFFSRIHYSSLIPLFTAQDFAIDSFLVEIGVPLSQARTLQRYNRGPELGSGWWV
jgi:hypothetical protein